MSDHDKYGTMRDDSNDDGSDPLGLIGWALHNKYRVTEYIGEGGFGEVYKGYNTSLKEQKVVIKILKRNHETEWSQKEARILGMLDHPNICRLVDFLPKDRALVIQYIDGKNFDEILRQGEPLTDKLFFRTANTLMDTLAFAHKRKVAHRDIKPSNIMLDRYGHIYIIDFGIAKKIGGTVTKTGLGAGWSFWTAAPERRHGRKGYNPFLSDIYEVGITLYYLATRLWPYSDPENPDPDRWGKSTDKPLSNRLTKVLRKATHPSPDMRFQSIDEMAHKMAGVRTIRKRSKTKYLVAALAVVAIGASYIGVYQPDIATFQWNAFIANLSESPHPQPEHEVIDNTSTQAEDEGEVVDQEQAQPEITAASGSVIEENIVPQQPIVEREESDPAEQVETVVVATQREEEPVEDSKPPLRPNLTVETVPPDNVILRIDGKYVRVGEKTSLKSGQHTVSVMHPEFPLLQGLINLAVDTVITYDLIKYAKDRRTTHISISTAPRIDGKDLAVWFNGRRHNIVGGRAMGVQKKEGKWMMAFQIVEKNRDPSTVSVDSFVVDLGPEGTVKTYQTSNTLVDLSVPTLDDSRRCKLVVFRSME